MNRTGTKSILAGAAVVFLLLIVFSSCSNDDSVVIAEQYGLAYAPLQIMRSLGYYEELEPELNVKWVQLGNTAAIREAVLAGEVDLGFMGLPPFLIGADNGMQWKLIAGLSVCPVGLVAGKEIRSFSDLTPDDRIALPQPGSIQHILLAMAAEKEYGDPAVFDKSLVTMKHPDGMAALLSGAVDAHFTSPPYIFLETANDGFKTILSGFDAFGGDFSFIGAMATDDFIKESPGQLKSFLAALEKSIRYINEDPDGAAAVLSEIYDLPPEQILDYLTRPGMRYTPELLGLNRFTEFMQKSGYLSEDLKPEALLYR